MDKGGGREGGGGLGNSIEEMRGYIWRRDLEGGGGGIGSRGEEYCGRTKNGLAY